MYTKPQLFPPYKNLDPAALALTLTKLAKDKKYSISHSDPSDPFALQVTILEPKLDNFIGTLLLHSRVLQEDKSKAIANLLKVLETRGSP